MNKYIDKNGLEYFWDNVNNIIVRNDVISTLGNLDFSPYTRYIFENGNEVQVASTQVSTLSEDELYWFVIMPTPETNNTDNLDSWLCTIDARTGILLNRTLLPIGHGRSLSIKDNKMLTTAKYDIPNNQWVIVNVENPTNPYVESYGEINGAHLFWTDDGAAYYNYNTDEIVFLDVSYDSNQRVSGFTENGKTIKIRHGVRGEEQSFYYWNGLIICASTLPEKITFIDSDTGNVVGTNELKSSYGCMRTAECEAAFVINDHLYFSNNSIATYLPDQTQVREVTLFRCDMFNPMGEWYDYWLDKSYQGSRGPAVNVSGSIDFNGISSVSFDGSAEYPFPLIEDAIISYSAKKSIKHSSMTMNLSISLTTDVYKYKAHVHNIDFVVGINGIAEKTTVNGFDINNAKNVLINRINVGKALFTRISSTYKIGLVSSNSNVRILSTSTFAENIGQSDYDIHAESNSIVMINCESKRIRATDSIVITSAKYEYMSETNSEVIRIAQAPFAGKAQSLQIGATETGFWVRTVCGDNTALSLNATESGIYFRKYNDYTDTSHHTTIGYLNWQSNE